MRICPSCGATNPARARFCLECGAPLDAVGELGPEERRVVTVLFCDIVGFTARSDRADPEEVKETLRLFHTSTQREIDRHGGTVVEFLGDGVLAAFGAPTAHEDDPERAVRAGLRIQQAIAELNAKDPELALTIRVGIETGEAVVSFAPGPQVGGNVTGDVTNAAARLQALAPPGGVVVGELAHRATVGLFHYRELEPALVKGKMEPLALWQPLASRSRPPEEARRRFRTPLVGRLDEMEMLERLLLRTTRELVPGFAVVVGEAGVGKTRLVTELAGRADDLGELIRWRQGRPHPYGEGVAFSALGDIVKSEAGILGSDTAGEAREKIQASLERSELPAVERESLLEILAPLVGARPVPASEGDEWTGRGVAEGDRTETFARWRRYLELLASDHPLVLVLEDLHQASNAFLDFVDDVLAWSAGLPMLVIAVGRPELLDRRPDWATWPGTNLLEVTPLPAREQRQLVHLFLQDVPLPPETIETVVERSEGIPLYAQEFAAMLRERADLPGESLAETSVPHSLRTLIAARLDSLPPQARVTLQDASIVGRTFWTGILEAMSAEPPETTRSTLDDLEEAEAVRRVDPSTFEGEREYAFSHALVRDAAYAQIPRRVRAAKHRAIAEWIERIAGDRVLDQAEVLAHHFGEAESLSRASGDGRTADELLGPTSRYLRLAAERALGLDAEHAHQLYERAISLLPPGHPDRARTLRDAGVAATALGRFEEGERLLRAALADYQERDDQTGRADVMVAMSRNFFERGEIEAVDSLLLVALGLLEELEPGPALARAYARYAGHLFVVGDYVGSLRRAEQGLTLARQLGLEREEVVALNYVGASRSYLGERDGLTALRRAVERGIELGLGAETAIAMNNLADAVRFLDGPAPSLEVWRRLLAFCEERGLASMSSAARNGVIQALFDLGGWDELLTLAAEADAWDRTHGVSPLGTAALIMAGWVAMRRGEIDRAEELSRNLVDRVALLSYPEYEAPAFVLVAEVALARGDHVLAFELLGRFEAATETDRLFRTTMLPVVARLLVALEDVERLRRFVAGAPDQVSTRERLSLESAKAELEMADGDMENAAGTLRAAADAWSAYGMPLEVGQLLLRLARCERTLGRDADAATTVAQAIAVLEPLGARQVLDEVERLR
jgi:class 3 adenylate cyclase/tetratricopeptide (TPR) repeat protein